MALNYFEIQRKNFLRLTEGPFLPNDERLGEIIADADQVTGFRFSYSNNEDGNTDYVKMIFIGEIVNFDHVKHLFEPNSYDMYKDSKFAVSYGPDGRINDVRVIDNGIDEAIAVSDRDELLHMYKEETGYRFVSGPSMA